MNTTQKIAVWLTASGIIGTLGFSLGYSAGEKNIEIKTQKEIALRTENAQRNCRTDVLVYLPYFQGDYLDDSMEKTRFSESEKRQIVSIWQQIDKRTANMYDTILVQH